MVITQLSLPEEHTLARASSTPTWTAHTLRVWRETLFDLWLRCRNSSKQILPRLTEFRGILLRLFRGVFKLGGRRTSRSRLGRRRWIGVIPVRFGSGVRTRHGCWNGQSIPWVLVVDKISVALVDQFSQVCHRGARGRPGAKPCPWRAECTL